MTLGEMALGPGGQVTTTNGGLPVGVTNSTLTWPEFLDRTPRRAE